MTEHLNDWDDDYGVNPITRESLLSRLDRWAMAIAATLVRLVVRGINLWFRMVER